MPKYKVVRQLGRDMQIRQYEQSVAVEANVSGGFNSPSDGSAFNDLAGYIGVNPMSVQNQSKEQIAMTSPVVNYVDNGVTRQQFILPSKNQANAPVPTSDKVRLV